MKRFCLTLVVTSMAVLPLPAFAQGATGAKTTAKTAGKAAAGEARTVNLVASDPSAPSQKYGYDVSTIDAKPGERIHIVLKALGTMPKMASSHNFVLFKPGTSDAKITAFLNESGMAAATDYVPADMASIVLAHTKMAVDGDGPVEVTFTAPTAPGSYTFACSFPGHAQAGMKGKLVVK